MMTEKIEKGINMLIGGEYRKAAEYFQYHYSTTNSDRIRHYVIISKLLSDDLVETQEFIKSCLPECPDRTVMIINSFINKNKNYLLKIKPTELIIFIAILLKKRGYMTEAGEYLKVSRLINPLDEKTCALSGELLLYEKKFKEGLEFMVKAAGMEG